MKLAALFLSYFFEQSGLFSKFLLNQDYTVPGCSLHKPEVDEETWLFRCLMFTFTFVKWLFVRRADIMVSRVYSSGNRYDS